MANMFTANMFIARTVRSNKVRPITSHNRMKYLTSMIIVTKVVINMKKRKSSPKQFLGLPVPKSRHCLLPHKALMCLYMSISARLLIMPHLTVPLGRWNCITLANISIETRLSRMYRQNSMRMTVGVIETKTMLASRRKSWVQCCYIYARTIISKYQCDIYSYKVYLDGFWVTVLHVRVTSDTSARINWF